LLLPFFYILITIILQIYSELPTHAKGDDWAFKNDL